MAIDSDESIAAIVDLGQTLRAEIKASEGRVREELVAFKADVREDFAGVRRDIALSPADHLRGHHQDLRAEDRVKDLERWKSESDAEKKRAKG